VTLSNIAVILINGGTDTEYSRYDLTVLGSLAGGNRLVIGLPLIVSGLSVGVLSISAGTTFIQNGGSSPDGVMLFDTINGTVLDALSYEGEITAAVVTAQTGTFGLVFGAAFTGLDPDDGSLIQVGNTGNDSVDWSVASPPTPGSAP
jgi:hypothetical protein